MLVMQVLKEYMKFGDFLNYDEVPPLYIAGLGSIFDHKEDEVVALLKDSAETGFKFVKTVKKTKTPYTYVEDLFVPILKSAGFDAGNYIAGNRIHPLSCAEMSEEDFKRGRKQN